MAAPAPAASYPPPGSPDTPVINPLNPPSGPRPAPGSRSVVLHLASQRFEYLEDDQVIHTGPISSGRAGYETPHGEFSVLSKDKDKESSRYDNQLGMDAWMPWSIQFYGDYFLHEGWLPGYPDSHGCVRVGEKDARFLFDTLRRGDRVLVTD